MKKISLIHAGNSKQSGLIKITLLLIIILLSFGRLTAQETKPVVYFIPGQGADSRLFKNLTIDDKFDIKDIEYFTPEKGSNMTDFAKVLATQIDTTRRFMLVGVSLGGMLATEMGDFIEPEKIIIVSSAKCRNEFPGRYKFQRSFPLYKLVPAGVVKGGAKIMQPLVEPDMKYDKETFKSMLNDKDRQFLKRTVKMILEWERIDYRQDIIHIHGDNDHTIPVRNVKYDHLIENGSHMMVLTRADELSVLLNHLLLE